MIGIFTVRFRPQMQRLYRIGAFCLLFFGLQLTSYAQWKPTNYPSKTPWLACSTPNGSLLVGSYTEPFEVSISTDKGNTFTALPALSGIAYTSSCQVGQTIFLGGFGGSVARSDDNGLTWQVSNFSSLFGPGIEVVDCYGLEYFKDKLFAAGFGAGIVYSDDMGKTWKTTDTSPISALEEGCYVYGLKAYKDVLYAFTVRGIYKYDEAGDQWSRLKETLYPAAVTIHKGDLYVGHSAPNGPFFILKTSDGTNWTEVAAPQAILTNEARALASYKDVLYVGSASNGIFYSADGGATWTGFSEGFPNSFQNFHITPLNFAFLDEEVYVTGFNFDNGGLFTREIAGGTALEAVSDMQYQVVFDQHAATLALSGQYVKARIAVYDMEGKLMCRRTVAPAESILLGQCPKGMYVYRVEIDGDNVITGKFVI